MARANTRTPPGATTTGRRTYERTCARALLAARARPLRRNFVIGLPKPGVLSSSTLSDRAPQYKSVEQISRSSVMVLWRVVRALAVVALAMTSPASATRRVDPSATSFVSAVPATANGSYGWKILGRPSGGRYASTTYYAAYSGKRAHQTIRKPLHSPRLLF